MICSNLAQTYAMNFFERRKILKSSNFLDLIPEKVIQKEDDDNERITLFVPRFRSVVLQKWLVPDRKTPFFRIHLDKNGSSVWRLIDANSTVDQIAGAFARKESITFDDSLERVTKFLQMLYSQRYITFVQLKENAEPEA